MGGGGRVKSKWEVVGVRVHREASLCVCEVGMCGRGDGRGGER